jgi:hypothetical protein
MDDRKNELKTEFEYHTSEQEAWREEPWSGMHILRDQAESLRRPGKKSSPPHYPDGTCVHRPFKDEAVEPCDMTGSGCSGSTHPLGPFGPTLIRQPLRPPISRSCGSSSASSASTLMTPRDPHSWVSSTHSPSFMESSDSIPTSSPYQLHILSSTKFAKDTSFGEFPTNREFRFPLAVTSNYLGSPEPEWFLDEHTDAMNLPVNSYPGRLQAKRSKRTRTLGSHQHHSKQKNRAFKATVLPGLGIISQDGSYNEGITLPSKPRARNGPLTPEQRYDAALMRRHGACRDCRKRKVKV